MFCNSARIWNRKRPSLPSGNMRPKAMLSLGCRCQRLSLKYGEDAPKVPNAGSVQAAGFETSVLVGSKCELGSTRNSGWPGTRFMKVQTPPQTAGLLEGPRARLSKRLLDDEGVAMICPLR